MNEICKRYVISYFHLKGFKPSEIKSELDPTLGDSSPSYSTIKFWVTELKRGRTDLQDEHRSGRPNSVTTPENILKNPKNRPGRPKINTRAS